MIRRENGILLAAMIALLTGATLSSAGCASALRPVPEDSPLRDRSATADPALAAELTERAALRFARRPERDEVLEAARLAIRAAGADPDAVEPITLAVRIHVWLASHPGKAAGDARAHAERAVEAGQLCRERAPAHEACDYWLAIAVGVQADVRRATALDGLDVMVPLLRAAIENVPGIDHAGPERVLARVLVNAPGWPTGPGDPDEGLELARAATERAPGWPPNWLALGEAQAEIGDRTAARSAYERALELAREAAEAGQPDAPEWIGEARRGLERSA